MLPCVLSRSITDATGRHSTVCFPGENQSWGWAGALIGALQPAPRQPLRAEGAAALAPRPALLFQASAVRAWGCPLRAGRPLRWPQQHSVPRSSVPPSQLLLVPSLEAVGFTLLTLPRPPPTCGSWVVSAGPPLGVALREGLGPRGQPRDPKDSACLSSLGHKLHRYPNCCFVAVPSS